MRVKALGAIGGAATAILLLSSCGAGPGTTEPTAASTTDNTADSGTSSETPAPTPTSNAITYVMRCSTTTGQTDSITDYRAGWTKPYDNCDTEEASGTIGDIEAEALKILGGEEDPNRIQYLYEICAETTGHYFSGNVSSDQAVYVTAALKLCPDHPKKAQYVKSVQAGKAKEAEEAKIMADRENGKFVVEGKYLVGKDVIPGLWQSQGDKVEECYWEISDAQGNILENNYINVAPQFTIRIPPTAAGFTVTNCSFRWIGN